MSLTGYSFYQVRGTTVSFLDCSLCKSVGHARCTNTININEWYFIGLSEELENNEQVMEDLQKQIDNLTKQVEGYIEELASAENFHKKCEATEIGTTNP